MIRGIIKILSRAANMAALFLYFCYKIIVSGWIVGWLVLKGYRGDRGLMVEYKTLLDSKWGLVLLFNLISMTPGSLSVDISDDDRTIQVHLLDSTGKDDFYAVTGKIERMIMKVFS